MTIVKYDHDGAYININGMIARPTRDTTFKQGDSVICRRFVGFYSVGVGKISGHRKYKEYWRIGKRFINIRDMFPIMPDNCDVYVDREAIENPSRIDYPLYYQVDGIFKGSHDGSHYETINLCKRGNFDEETTLLWFLKFGEYVPKYYEDTNI